MPSLGSFQDYLSAAVQLKTALVKAKPGRQEWEQAPPFLRCTATSAECVQRARQGGFSIQYSTALQLKEKGNELVAKDPEAALGLYVQALSVFLWFDRGPDKAAEDVPLVCAADKLKGGEQEQAHHLLSISFCNAAACLLQLGMTADAAYACSKALKYDPYNVKALYRRAIAHRDTNTTAGLEAAAADLAAANQLEPANSEVRAALNAVQLELRQHRRQERGLYGNMFERGELYDEPGGSGAGAAGGGVGPARRPPAGRDAATAAAATGEFEDGDEDEPGGGLDPEDLLFLDPVARKAESAVASREAHLVMRTMQRSLARSRNRKLAQRLDAERAQRAGRFPWWAVPWWAYVLIGLHLAYRLIKMWRVPVPVSGGGGLLAGDTHTQGPQIPDGPVGHVEL